MIKEYIDYNAQLVDTLIVYHGAKTIHDISEPKLMGQRWKCVECGGHCTGMNFLFFHRNHTRVKCYDCQKK